MQWKTIGSRFISLIPETPGVYLIVAGGNIVYVGQAKNLCNRIEQHFSESETNSDLKAYIKKYTVSVMYAEVEKMADLDSIECDLYDLYKPVCNQVSPPRN